jgi:hypothetical protein
MTIHEWDGVAVLDLGEMDIWDGADLSLLRETLFNLIVNQKRRLIGVNMHWVKYIPSGFFGMLFDWHEQGIEIYLYKPQHNVGNMLWFRRFFEHQEDGRFVLCSEPKILLPSDVGHEQYGQDKEWDEEELERSFSTIVSRESGPSPFSMDEF